MGDLLALKFGTRWIVTRKDSKEYYASEATIAVCRNQEIALNVIRSMPDYDKYKIEYDCIEIDNYE